MIVFLVIISLINIFIIFLFSGGLMVAAGMGGDSSAAGEVIAISAVIVLAFSIILPWILLIRGRKSGSQTNTILEWIGAGLALIPLILSLIWFTLMSTGVDLPLEPPPKEEINTDLK